MSKRHWILGTLGLITVFSIYADYKEPRKRSPETESVAVTSSETLIGTQRIGAERVSPFAYILPAPYDAQPKLASDFGMQLSDDVILTASGYPIIRANNEVPVCATSWLAKEAADAWKQQDRRWLDSMKDCILVPSGTDAEWLNGRPRTDAFPIRIAFRDGTRVTVYVYRTLMDNFGAPSLAAARAASHQTNPSQGKQ